MTRRRRAANRLADLTDEERASYVLAAVVEPAVAPNLKAEVDSLGSPGRLWLGVLPELVRRKDPDLTAAAAELIGIDRKPERPYNPTCFQNPNCDCSACVEMRRIEAAEVPAAEGSS